MRTQALMEELLNLARGRGLVVRREAMSRGAGAGGLCVLKGKPTVFVDDRAALDAQLEVLSAVLRRFDWTGVELSPAARGALKLDAPPAPAPAPRKPRPRNHAA